MPDQNAHLETADVQGPDDRKTGKFTKKKSSKWILLGCLPIALFGCVIVGSVVSELNFRAKINERLDATNQLLKPLGGYITNGRRSAQDHILLRIHPSPNFTDDKMPLLADALRPWTHKNDPDVGLLIIDLVGTAITDKGLTALESLERIDHIYLWDTQVTEQGVMDWLKKAKSYPGVIPEYKRPMLP